MEQDRRTFLTDAGRWLLLTGAAALAWDHVVAGAPEKAPNYDDTRHWWGMIIDIEKCIGCGNCVRACKAENDVPRRAGLLPHVGRALPGRSRATSSTPSSTRPTAGTTGFPEIDAPSTR